MANLSAAGDSAPDREDVPLKEAGVAESPRRNNGRETTGGSIEGTPNLEPCESQGIGVQRLRGTQGSEGLETGRNGSRPQWIEARDENNLESEFDGHMLCEGAKQCIP